MRVLIGLAALAAVGVNAQTPGTATPSLVSGGTAGTAPTTSQAGTTTLFVGPSLIAVTTGAPANAGTSAAPGSLPANAAYVTINTSPVGGVNGVTPSPAFSSTDRINNQAYAGTVSASTTQVYIEFNYNSLVGEVQYQTSLGRTSGSFVCDPCDTTGCSSGSQAGPTSNGNACANLIGRVFTVTLPVGQNQFKIQWFDYVPNVNSNSFTATFGFTRPATVLVGDPQIVGMQGQDFQVHGMPDEIFNMVTYPNVQVNARFSYLSEAECPDNYTTCFAHPGTYISEQGIRVGNDKVRVVAGPAKKGLSVHVNGKKVHQKTTHLKLGSVEIVNHRRVVVKTPIAALTMTNSDKFMNQEINMFDEKLLALGSKRHALKAGQAFHPEVPLHGLQGQTWRNVEYPSGLEYEGSIMDYHVVDGNLFGSDFVFNKFDL